MEYQYCVLFSLKGKANHQMEYFPHHRIRWRKQLLRLPLLRQDIRGFPGELLPGYPRYSAKQEAFPNDVIDKTAWPCPPGPMIFLYVSSLIRVQISITSSLQVVYILAVASVWWRHQY